MLLTDYSKKTQWYAPFVDEIFTGITLEDITVDENAVFAHQSNLVLSFCVELGKAIYTKLLETNNARDIHIYLVALKVASYEPDIILSSIYKKNAAYFKNYPILFLLLFSRDNLFKYRELRNIYEAWYE